MSRYTNVLQLSIPVAQALPHLENYLIQEGFTKIQHEGEIVFKKGIGLMIWPQFVKLEAQGDNIQLQAWIKFPLLPGVYLGELGIHGWFAFFPKKKLKDRVTAIESFVHQTRQLQNNPS